MIATGSIASFVLGATVIAVAGVALTRVSSALSRRTGLGEAFFGAVFLGAVTSLPGVAASVSAAVQDRPELALANAIGGIAAQTAFLAVADIVYRRANLEHAAASLGNMLSAATLIALLTIPLIGSASPEVTIFGAHPASLAILPAYLLGLRLVHASRQAPGWRPRWTRETEEERPEASSDNARGPALGTLWLQFAVLALVVAAAGHFVAGAGIAIVEQGGISETAAGALLTAIATSLPELVTAVAAVRTGALRLAVGDILGGNCFDVLFVSAADMAYRSGSILHAAAPPVFLVSISILLTAILMLGLLHREKHGIANIGFESFLVLVLYLGSAVLLALR